MKYFPTACLMLLAALIGVANLPQTESHSPGILADSDPVQIDLPNIKPWKKNGYLIRPLAQFQLTARTLLTTRYSWGREADISPIDLTLGWGPMSDSSILSKLTIMRGNRSYAWKTKELPLSPDEINRHAANMHLIPATDYIGDTLFKIIPGNLVELKGYLIQAAQADGWSWTSSLTREDSGHGACEVIWVESAKIIQSGK